jgi:hypothetical protein
VAAKLAMLCLKKGVTGILNLGWIPSIL